MYEIYLIDTSNHTNQEIGAKEIVVFLQKKKVMDREDILHFYGQNFSLSTLHWNNSLEVCDVFFES